MRLLQVPQVSRATTSTDRYDFVYFGAHWVGPFDGVVYGFVADAAWRLLREHALACEVAGLTVDAAGIPVIPVMGHVDSKRIGGFRDACCTSDYLFCG